MYSMYHACLLSITSTFNSIYKCMIKTIINCNMPSLFTPCYYIQCLLFMGMLRDGMKQQLLQLQVFRCTLRHFRVPDNNFL